MRGGDGELDDVTEVEQRFSSQVSSEPARNVHELRHHHSQTPAFRRYLSTALPSMLLGCIPPARCL